MSNPQIALAALFLLNFSVSAALLRSPYFPIFQKTVQILIVRLLPIFGAIFI